MKRRRITGPVAAIICTGIVAFAATLILAPDDVRHWLLAGEGVIGIVVAAYLRSPRDSVLPGGES